MPSPGTGPAVTYGVIYRKNKNDKLVMIADSYAQDEIDRIDGDLSSLETEMGSLRTQIANLEARVEALENG